MQYFAIQYFTIFKLEICNIHLKVYYDYIATEFSILQKYAVKILLTHVKWDNTALYTEFDLVTAS